MSVAVFAIASLVLIFAVRPLALGRFRPSGGVRTGAAALVGSRGVVIERIAFPNAGTVKINGEVWTARAYGEGDVIEPDTLVYVMEIQGATALVTE